MSFIIVGQVSAVEDLKCADAALVNHSVVVLYR